MVLDQRTLVLTGVKKGPSKNAMPETELTKLRCARSRAILALKQAEAQVAAHQTRLADLEARIKAISPELDLPTRRRRPIPVFARGALWCTNTLRIDPAPPRLACQRIRAEAGMPSPVIRLSALHPIFASVR
jgi:hypothetical protein